MPHSEIHGSKLILSSPWLIAEYHVFHRLLLPRHPPNALFALDLIQKKSDFFCGSSLLYKKGPINQKCIHCIDGRWFSFRQRSNEITLIPVSVLDLNKIDFQRVYLIFPKECQERGPCGSLARSGKLLTRSASILMLYLSLRCHLALKPKRPIGRQNSKCCLTVKSN